MSGKTKFKRSLSTGLMLCGAAATVMFAGAPKASAANTPVTFAQFIQATTSANANLFSYIDNGPNADAVLTTQSGGVNGVAIPVVFTFQSVNGSLATDLQGPQQAMLTLTSSTNDPVTVGTVFGQRLAHQELFGNVSETDVLTITRDTAAAEGGGTKTDLLTMTFTGGLLGRLGSTTPSLSGDTSNGEVVTYASDFLNFSPTADNDFNQAFSSWTTTADGNGLEQSPTAGDNYFASATAAASATFDTSFTPTVISFMPEPSMAGIIALAGMAVLGGRRRRTVTC